MFTKIKQALFKHKLFLTKIAVFFWLYFLMTDFSFASAQNDVDFKKIEDWFIQITTWISTIISVLLWALTYLVTLFLTPEWTSGTVFGLSKNLKDIWVLMSNIVYFAFAFILIAIAFANIVWTQWDFALKQALPRFIVWILIVPFSWFIVQFFVSLSSILTISALNLPFEVFQDYKSQMSEVDIPKNCTLNLWILWEQEWKNSWETTKRSNKNYMRHSCKSSFWFAFHCCLRNSDDSTLTCLDDKVNSVMDFYDVGTAFLNNVLFQEMMMRKLIFTEI